MGASQQRACPNRAIRHQQLLVRYGVENSANGKNLKYVVKASFEGHDYYAIGSYDSDKEKFVPDSKGGYSGAGLTSRKKGWAGIQSVPRQVYLSNTGRQLVQWPVEETEKLRDNHVSYYGKKLKGKSLFEVTGITAPQVDIELSFKLPKIDEAEVLVPEWDDPQILCSTKTARVGGRAGAFGLLVMASQDLTEQTAVFFRVFKDNHQFVVLMCSDQSRSSLRQGIDKTTYGAFIHMDHEDEVISLRSLVDHLVIESFGAEGRACITVRVYPQFHVKKEAHVYVFNNGSREVVIKKLDAWSMKRTKGN
ncbi:hypothetical protein L1987_81038 [Smallanthus sonchifolius]|uniref:Uncharacterized protein n=1 Tax=Smallanthus sonchifolius TaxID=185202 RepID=A0ACB8YPI7_9ASTR|nr:hypothetical protein L1987_81038 [Smallanthus sonchifolius]